MRSTGSLLRFGAVMGLLLTLQFAARPRLGDPRFAPDFVLLALVFLAMRTRPAVGAIAGFLVGLTSDALAPTAFGAMALACTAVGWLSGWLKSVVFADNLLVTALFVFGAAWVRDVIATLASNQLEGRALAWQLLALSPLAALATAVAGFALLLLFRSWLSLRPAR